MLRSAIVEYPVCLRVNGRERRAAVEARTLLSELLRETFALVGTKIGCDGSGCGACTVLLDGLPVRSCTLLALQADGRSVVTVEGLDPGADAKAAYAGAAPSPALDRVQVALIERCAFPCGFCAPGVVAAARDAASSGHLGRGSERGALRADAARMLRGNLCSCGGTGAIREAVEEASRRSAKVSDPEQSGG